MDEFDRIIEEKKAEIRLLEIVEGILQEGNGHLILPKIRKWYNNLEKWPNYGE